VVLKEVCRDSSPASIITVDCSALGRRTGTELGVAMMSSQD
jgi:hypothetical protein